MWMKAKVCHQNNVILPIFTNICNTSGFNCFFKLSVLIWNKQFFINSYWPPGWKSFQRPSHKPYLLTESLSASSCASVVLRANKGHCNNYSRGLLCPWLVHGLHFSGNLLSEIITATSFFTEPSSCTPVHGIRFIICFCSISLMFADERQ